MEAADGMTSVAPAAWVRSCGYWVLQGRLSSGISAMVVRVSLALLSAAAELLPPSADSEGISQPLSPVHRSAAHNIQQTACRNRFMAFSPFGILLKGYPSGPGLARKN